MRDLLDRFIRIERHIAETRGSFAVFGLFLREDAPDKWDLLVAAPWLEDDSPAGLEFIAEQVQDEFNEDQLSRLSRIVVIKANNPALAAINNSIRIEHGGTEFQNCTFFGLSIRHAFIITSSNGRPS